MSDNKHFAYLSRKKLYPENSNSWREEEEYGYLLLILSQHTDDWLHCSTNGVSVTPSKYLYN